MFDISYSKIIILASIALIVVGPKDLPRLLRAVGKYLGIIKRQAAEFRSQFDDAMRESELADLKKEIETLGQDAHATLSEAERSVQSEISGIESELDRAGKDFDQPGDHASTPMLSSDADAAIALSAADVDAGASLAILNGAGSDHGAQAPRAPAIAHAPVAKPAPALETAGGDAAPRTGA